MVVMRRFGRAAATAGRRWLDVAAAGAFFSAFSLAPTLVIVIAIGGTFFGPEAVRGQLPVGVVVLQVVMLPTRLALLIYRAERLVVREVSVTSNELSAKVYGLARAMRAVDIWDPDWTRTQCEENGLESRTLAAYHCDGQRLQACRCVDVLHGSPAQLEAVEVTEPRARASALRADLKRHIVDVGFRIHGKGVLGVAVVDVPEAA